MKEKKTISDIVVFLRLSPENAEKAGMPEKTELTWTTEHSASSYNMGVLVDGTGNLFDGFLFRYYRDTFGAWIETNRPKKVRMALGLRPN